jgi:hypothetical protein
MPGDAGTPCKTVQAPRKLSCVHSDGDAADRTGTREIGIGVGLAASPSHTTVHTGPYTAVRWIKLPL